MEVNKDVLENRIRELLTGHEVEAPVDAWKKIEGTLNNTGGLLIPIKKRWYLGVAAAILMIVTAGVGIRTIMMEDGSGIHSDTPIMANHTVKPAQKPVNSVFNPEATVSEPIPLNQSASLHSGVGKNHETTLDGHSKSNRAHTNNPHEITPEMLTIPIEIPNLSSSEQHLNLIPVISYANIILKPYHLTRSVPCPDQQPHREGSLHRLQILGYAGSTFASYYPSEKFMSMDALYESGLLNDSRNHSIKPMASTGMGIGYRISNRISIFTGASINQYSAIFDSPTESAVTILSNYRTISNAFGDIQLNTSAQKDLASYPLLEVNSNTILQQFSWVEVPLMGSYLLTEKPVSVAVKVGIGGNFLTRNRTIIQEGAEYKEIGYTSGLQTIYMSGVLGIDIGYHLGKSWIISFNPLFRQSLQPVSTESSKPYLMNLGVYSGISYRFSNRSR